MPELPDVELFKRYLDAHALRQRIEGVHIGDARILDGISARQLATRLEGRAFEASRRHGKHLLVQLTEDGWLTLHFGMTGSLAWFDDPADDPPYDRVRFDFTGGRHLAYVNRRMLGRVGFAEDADAFVAAEKLGPDALDPGFDRAAFERVLGGRGRELKALLMDQSVIAGIGNIYADEILFQARLHPRTRTDQLDGGQRRQLFDQLRRVLETAIACGAGAEQFLERLPEDFLLPRRQAGGRCPRCGAELQTLKSGGRTSVISAAVEHRGGTQGMAFATIAEKIGANTRAVLEEAARARVAPRAAAIALARRRVEAAMRYRRWA